MTLPRSHSIDAPRRTNHRLAAITLVTLLGALSGGCCAPKVVQFEASPKHVAAGESAKLRWKVTGTATLSAQPPSNHDGPVDSTGEISVVVTQPTTFRLDVQKCGKTAFAEQSIAVEGSAASCCTADPSSMSCEPGGVVASLTLKQEDWDSLLVGSVRGRDLALTVDHEGRAAELQPHASSDAFRGTPIVGVWRFHYKTPEGRPCPSPENASLVLGIDVQTESHP